jgi:hypothetical protein
MRATCSARPAWIVFVLSACGPAIEPGAPEEVLTAEADVPLVVRATARRICERLGPARTGRWAWDEESGDWEVEVLGLARQAELDILPDGRFSELELVHGLAEVRAALPEVALTIDQKCHDDERVLVELSLRSEAHLDPLPELAAAWALDAVVLEFQCRNGRDFELDARHLLREDRVDDIERAPVGE